MTTTLALETSTDACCVGVKHGDLSAKRIVAEARVHARVIMREVDAVLTEVGCRLPDIDRITFGKGPGSFTGVRIAVALAQGMASGLKIPVLGISSLRVIAQTALMGSPTIERISVLQDARLGEVYFGNYDRSADGIATPLAPDSLLAPENAATHLLSAATGTALDTFPVLLERAESVGTMLLDPIIPDPLALLALAEGAGEQWYDASEAQAAYLREKVAEKMSERR